MKIVFIQTSSFAGLHDNLHEGRFKWFDGLRFQHGVCVPVHANGGHTENCIAWSIEKPEGCWEDRRCYEKIPYTCRIPVEGDLHYPLTPANITITSLLDEHYYANTFIADHYNWELPLKDLKAVCKFLIVHKLYLNNTKVSRKHCNYLTLPTFPFSFANSNTLEVIFY